MKQTATFEQVQRMRMGLQLAKRYKPPSTDGFVHWAHQYARDVKLLLDTCDALTRALAKSQRTFRVPVQEGGLPDAQADTPKPKKQYAKRGKRKSK